MTVNIDTVLNGGTYNLKLDGTGNTNVGDYGSLGSYTINGTINSLPISSVVLNGTIEKNKHNLNWKIIADEAIKEIVVESSKNGINFNSLASVNTISTKYSTPNYNEQNVYYRLKVKSVINQTAYSNTIALKNSTTIGEPFVVNTLVADQLKITYTENYIYNIIDISGKVVAKGNGITGNNYINFTEQGKGMYILNFFTDDKNYIKKIIKN
jgi:hypothetical protein